MPKEKQKKAVHKKVGERVEKHVKHHPPVHNEHGHVIEEAHDEVIEVVVPVMGTVYEEMTDDEVKALEEQQQLPHVPTLEERVTELERIVGELTAKPKPKPKP